MKAIGIWMLGASVSIAAPAWPPVMPGGKSVAVVEGPRLLESPVGLREGVVIAKSAPRVSFYYYDCQTYEGNPWSVWGDGLFADGKYYSSVGDHRSPGGNAFVYEFDLASGRLRKLNDIRSILNRPDGWYTPGKIHSTLGLGKDGWIYFSTHRGSTRVAMNPANHYEGDWILRVRPSDGKGEVVAAAPLDMQCLPTGVIDGERMIWYAGTADGLNKKPPRFMAYDLAGRKILHADDHGPHRAMILSRSTGRLYFNAGEEESKKDAPVEQELRRFDPKAAGNPEPLGAKLGLRAASAESPDGMVYTIDGDRLWSFDTRTELVRSLGPTAVGAAEYTTNLDIDPTGRFLYYVPGAHGGAEKDGTPVVQYDLKSGTRKVLCFLHPALQESAGYIPIGTFGSALSTDGSTLYVTWNGAHDIVNPTDRVPFQSVAMTVIEIPESERKSEP